MKTILTMSLNKLVIVIIFGVIITSVITASSISEHFVDAGTTKKFHFTKTITSSQDPGQGHESHQLALILSPNKGTIYDGSLTFTSNKPVQVMVLHEITAEESLGQPVWTVDGESLYGISVIELGTSASYEFTGAALALHSTTEKFTATVSVDGWIRGQPTEVLETKIESPTKDTSLPLSRTNVPATIPLHEGFYEGQPVLYIITDSSDTEYSKLITEKQDWRVELAPLLNYTSDDVLRPIYVFTNGEKGDGLYGFQKEVFATIPTQTDYSALSQIIEVSWKKGQHVKIFDSAKDIIQEKENGRIEFKETNVVINTPQIAWPGGQMKVRDSDIITDEMEYSGGQITEINQDDMTVTFVAHRGWGPDGRTIYYIVTDATPSGPAEMMGVTHSPSSANLITNPAAADLYQFNNGIKGSGPLGFQAGIAAAAPGDDNYSPMWRIFLIEWNNLDDAKILETISDLDWFRSEDKITISIARPMTSDHIVNCPFIDPFQ